MLVNIPGLVLLTTLCSLAGMVVYAEYHRCDPLHTDRIQGKDQVARHRNIRVAQFQSYISLSERLSTQKLLLVV